LAQPKGLATD